LHDQPNPNSLKTQQSKLKYIKWTLQIGVWLFFGLVTFSIIWGDLLMMAAFTLLAVACYAAIVYYFENKLEAPQQANLQ